MKITILTVGKIKEKYTLEWEKELSKRVSPYTKIEFIEIKEEPITNNKNFATVKTKEAKRIIKRIPERSFIIALDMKGSVLTSEKLSEKIRILLNQTSHITFIIGGPVGLDKEVLQKANLKLSFSSFTFTHQIMRVLLLEQMYRSFCILNNRPYHL